MTGKHFFPMVTRGSIMEDTILLIADLKRHKGSPVRRIYPGTACLYGVGNGSFIWMNSELSQGRNGAGRGLGP